MISPVTPLPNSMPPGKSVITTDQSNNQQDQILREKSIEFEAVFIGQMLKFSGFDKALTMGGGDDASAFTGMYIQEFAEKIAESGGFGLAEKIYNQMSRLDSESGLLDNKGADNVYPDKL